VPVTESFLPRLNASGAMDQSFLRERAERARGLAQDSTEPVLRANLLRLADDYQMRADELENDEKHPDPD
jgi:hypothetical protein